MLIVGIALAALILILMLMVWYVSHGAPFVPTSDERTRKVIQAMKQLNANHIVDLGCGDGKLVIALAKAGYKVDGIEIQPWLVRRAKRNIKKLGLEKQTNIYWGSFWKFNVAKYDVVVLFGVKHIMRRMEHKLLGEMAPKSHVISNFFTFPNLQEMRRDGEIRTYKV